MTTGSYPSAAAIVPASAAAAAIISDLKPEPAPGGAGARGRKSRAERVLAKAIAFIHEHLQTGFHMSHLCRAADVSERTLYLYFRKLHGTSPKQYAMRRRLLWVRAMLTNPKSGRLTVKEAAFSAGFRELGRFSSYYRQTFGETPSKTLSQQGSARARLPAHRSPEALSLRTATSDPKETAR